MNKYLIILAVFTLATRTAGRGDWRAVETTDVQTAFLAALNYFYADVAEAKKYLNR